MIGNFDTCLKLTLAHEGGWADDPADPGGATMRGVTLQTYRDYKGRAVTKAELRAISDAELSAIYRKGYWDALRCDDLPPGLDYVAFDAAVNSGPRRSAQWLQQAAGVAADGAIGPKTLAAVISGDWPSIIRAATANRLAFVRGLATWRRFGAGWSDRIAKVTSDALAMATATADQPSPSINWLGALLRVLLALFRKGA